MPKRSHADFAGDRQAYQGDGPSKRNLPTSLHVSKGTNTSGNDLDLLVQHADELIDCLRSLKAQNKQDAAGYSTPAFSSPDIERRLAVLSPKVLPAFRNLAEAAGLGQADELSRSVRDQHHQDWLATSSLPPDSPMAKSAPSHKPPQPPQTTFGLQVPSFFSTSAWELSDISTSLPPLPAVLNPELETAALTHSGSVDPTQRSMSYERLEWLGDCYIELFATCFIFQTFGALAPGKCSQIREILVRNITLAAFCEKYGLPQRAILPREFSGGPMPPGSEAAKKSEVIKVHGDIFEAYVAAVILSDPENGLPRAATWLKALWSRTIERQIRDSKKKPTTMEVRELGQGAAKEKPALPSKVQLANALVLKGVELLYEDEPSRRKKDRDNGLPLFTVGVYLKGWGEERKFLGVGTAQGKREAGERAAQQALENKKVMKIYSEKKKAYLAAREAEAQSGGGTCV